MVILIIIRVLNFGQIGVILYKYNCGAREFVTPAHFTLGPKTRAEEGYCRGTLLRTYNESPNGLEI